jgi:hypothetical protein
MSSYVKATNFATKDTLTSGDSNKIVKGTELDNEFNSIAGAISSKSDIASPTFTGTPAAPTATAGSNTTQLANTAYVKTAIDSIQSFVAGMIIIWSGSSASIPSGWLLCNGTSSTPDLRNRFIVGAGSTYAVGAIGGSADAIVVSHTHAATVTDPGHNHTYDKPTSSAPQSGSSTQCLTPAYASTSTGTATTGITVTNASTGSSGTNANLPPYYALCYIMKS